MQDHKSKNTLEPNNDNKPKMTATMIYLVDNNRNDNEKKFCNWFNY